MSPASVLPVIEKIKPTPTRPVGAERGISAARKNALDLLRQSAWSTKEKVWFEGDAADFDNATKMISSVKGWLYGLDGARQTLGQHPDSNGGSQNNLALIGADGKYGFGRQIPTKVQTASFQATIAAGILTVTQMNSGAIAVGNYLWGGTVFCTIATFGTSGTTGTGGVGTYSLVPVSSQVPANVSTAATFQTYAVTSAATGNLLSSANAKIPSAVAGVSKMTLALIFDQPVHRNGWILSTDDMATGANQLCFGFLGTDGRYYAYTDKLNNKAVRSGYDNNPAGGGDSNPGIQCAILKFDGTSAITMLRNGVSVPLAVTGTAPDTVVSQRFRIGSSRIAAGASFDNAADGPTYHILAFPDVSSDIDLVVKGLFLEDHPGQLYA